MQVTFAQFTARIVVEKRALSLSVLRCLFLYTTGFAIQREGFEVDYSALIIIYLSFHSGSGAWWRFAITKLKASYGLVTTS